jgi:serine protease DegQ
MHRLWLIFAQTATVCLAVLFVVSTLRPDLLPQPRGEVVTIREPFQPAAAPPGPASEAVARTAPVTSLRAAAARATPSVVNVFTTKEMKVARIPNMNDPLLRKFFGNIFGEAVQRASSLGSGVIVSTEGYVLTNNHVVDGADEIELALIDGRRLSAHIVGVDPDTDLAVLKTERKGLPAITFAPSDKARVGDVVLAIGNPFGVGQTVTSGIVSALGRSQIGINTYENFIQTDAAINPGNSGGALVDSNGHLIGINTAIFSKSGGNLGIGFAIPVSVARHVMESIMTRGAVTRGWIGIEPQNLALDLADAARAAQSQGVLVANVMPSSPAAEAGIRRGDVLLTIEGKPVNDMVSLLNVVAALKPGSQAALTLLRDRNELDLNVTVGRRSTPPIR